MKKFIAVFGIMWIIIFIISFFTAEVDITIRERITYTLPFAMIAAAGVFFSDNEKPYAGKKDTGLMSCKKCGYLGAGVGGICPRCGWNYTEKITNQTTIVSCRACGYLGAGVPGYCTRCGSNRVVKINK